MLPQFSYCGEESQLCADNIKKPAGSLFLSSSKQIVPQISVVKARPELKELCCGFTLFAYADIRKVPSRVYGLILVRRK